MAITSSSGSRRVQSAAVYARISSDPSGESLGVQRQLDDCRELARSRGWVIGQEYVDNDVSAYSGKSRPAYRRMFDDLRSGARDAVIVYNLDRLHRQPSELEAFVDLCESTGVRDVATVTADIDLGNDDGLFMARIFAAFAAKESGRKSARITRKALANAHAGLPHGPARPFGYENDKVTIRESEAAIIRRVVERFLAGESLRSLTAWLVDEGVPTVRGAAWRPNTLGTMIRSPRIAGLREYKGEVIGQAVWPAIITPAEREQVLARFTARRSSGRRAPRRFLLSGLLRCGRCDTPLYTSTQHVPPKVGSDEVRRVRRYVCSSGPAHGGCGRVTIVAEAVEQILTAAVLARLDSPQLADALSGRVRADEQLSQLQRSVDAAQARLDELATLYADGAITAREWMTARTPIESRIKTVSRQIVDQTSTRVLDGLIGHGNALAGQWDDLNLDRQHAIIRAVLDYAAIAPATTFGTRTVALERIHPQWLL
ncbi:recombinase family protein [Tsukamurella tyrosinosolvens]|uniref:recombinase family protein n=1 Tax=Tsukamurella tyrosinosolvens TaxID=57704 RepID=UPI002DD442E2|nr:recombinase family protein [Tsukamurella tyrosinosolvens]MEC4613173.1 recombinase family protein [Tsukamurella tyrosinosolvens]